MRSRIWFSIRALARSLPFIFVLCYLVGFLATYCYSSRVYYRDPTSFFFDPTRAYTFDYSSKREKQADYFIKALNHSVDALVPLPSPFMCIGIPTIVRSEEQYLPHTIGSLLEGLSDEQRRSIHLIVFFAHTDPHRHPIYNEPWLKGVANEIIGYRAGDVEMARLRSFEENHQYWNKSMYDYEYLLKKCLNTSAPWIMIVEDDVLAKADWYSQAKNALEDIQAQMKDSAFLYLRLFYTEKLFGWNREEWLQYLGWSLFLFLITATTLVLGRCSSRHLRNHLSHMSIAIACFFCLPGMIALYFMAGRTSMQPLPLGLQRMEKFGCCSQGLIFPRQIVPRVMGAVNRATDQRYYVDMTLERWADAEGLARFALVPSLLQHVGSKSSKGSRFDAGANSIWNFEFENYT